MSGQDLSEDRIAVRKPKLPVDGDMIPSQLRNRRFVKLHGKAAFEKFNIETGAFTYAWDDPQFQDWLSQQEGYGVLAGYDHLIIDADTHELAGRIKDKLPRTFTVHTPGHNGLQFHYRCNNSGKTITLLDKSRPKPDWNIGHVKMANGYGLGPGSRHPNGKLYTVADDVPVAEVSEEQVREALATWMAQQSHTQEREESRTHGDINFSISELTRPITGLKKLGDRLQGAHPVHGSTTGTNFNVNLRTNEWYCFRCCTGGGPWQLLAVLEGVIDCSESVRGALRGHLFNQVHDIAIQRGLVKPIESDDEDSAANGTGRGKKSARLVELILDSQPKPVLFHDERRTGYVKIKASPPRIMPIDSHDFKTHLAGRLWEQDKKVPGSEDLNSAINVLEYHALKKKRIRLETRICWHEGAIWLDMANDEGQAIKITPAGWSIEDDPPILFRRFYHQKPLVTPVEGGDPWRLLAHANIAEEYGLLVMTYIATLLIPSFPHPILNSYGSQGAAKTTLQRMIKQLIDPSEVKLLRLPRDETALIQQLDHHWLPFYDNVSRLTKDMSDALCSAVTGLGSSKRRLYTDDSDFTYSFMRCIGLNGINVVARSPDLLDRSILLEHPPIPDEKKRNERTIWDEYNRDESGILGGFLDVVARAFAMPEPTLSTTNRMADFTSWGYRIAEALREKAGSQFLQDYTRNISSIALEAVNGDVIGDVILRTFPVEWDGTTTDLLNLLSENATLLKMSTRQKIWPKSPDALGRRLRILKEPLGRLGWSLEFDRISRGTTVKILRNSVSSYTSATNATSDTFDTNFQTSTEDKTLYDLVLSAATRLTKEKGQAERSDLEAALKDKAPPEQIDSYMEQIVKDSLAVRLDWGKWRALH